MIGEKYKELKKEIKQKIKKIKDYEIDDNKLAALVFIITAVLGGRIGSYLRIFVFNHEEKKRNKEKEKDYSSLKEEPELEEWELGRPRDDESKGDDDDRAGTGAYDVSLFGKKNKSKRNKKIALAAVLGGGLGVGTGFYLRNKLYSKIHKKERKSKKEVEHSSKEIEAELKRLKSIAEQKESDAPEPVSKTPRKKIESNEEFIRKHFNKMNISLKDEEDFGIKSYDINSKTTGIQEEEDFYRSIRELEKSKKKLKEDKKQTKKTKKLLSSNKDANEKISIINKKIEENEKQSKQIENFYDNYFKQKEKRLTKKDLIRILSREEGEDKDNLKYYSYWELYKMYEEIMGKQEEISSVLDSDDDPVQEVMLFGKKKRNRRNKKRK